MSGGPATDRPGMVTAIVPAYERPDYVVAAIRSALAQTYPHVEVLVGDDSHSDAVEVAVRTIDDRRVRYHRNRPSLGAMGNWIDLIRRADTELVSSLNDDDLWEPTFLDRLVPPMLADPSLGMAFCDTTYIDDAGTALVEASALWSHVSHRGDLPTGRVSDDPTFVLRMIAVWNAPQPAYAAVMRRCDAAAIDFPQLIDPCHDLWCTYRLWTAGARFFYVNERLTRYRVHEGNLTSAGFGKAEDFIFDVIATEHPHNPAIAEMRERWARIRFSRAMRSPRDDAATAMQEMRVAAPDLTGWRGAIARVASRAPWVCRATLTARHAAKRAIATVHR